ncbi:MAG: penicillin-binding transpeptidase domain-containing protein [Firmicutes bacterium]|nr:penicillin-binding transpeptidase domain-containing protein [Bacillota bacterium]
MSKKILQSRYYQLVLIITILMLALCIRLFVLTVIQEDKWAEAAVNQNTKEMVISAPRGEILDRYGKVLATNKQVFTVTFNVSGMGTNDINRSAYSLVKLLEKNGDEYVDNFPIVFSENGEFKYTYDENRTKWLTSIGLSADATCEDAFNKLRQDYEIDPDLDRYDALEVMQETHGVWPPVNIRSMTFTYDSRKKAFLEKYGLDTDLTAEEAFNQLRKKYSLDEPLYEGEDVLSDGEVRKIFTVREEIKNIGYNKYRSSTIAGDVSDETVAYVEEMGDTLRGVEIASETVRVYPEGTLLSHALGYMGSISDSQYDEYVNEKGYNADDLIGKDGLEASLESVLHGTDGIKTVLVNSNGDYIETLGETEPVAGKNVYLTIDSDLQKVAEEALEKAIKATASGGVFESKYGNMKLRKYENCGSGAAVAIDVETGDVLAMASYPDYDPNIFAEGISNSAWASVQSTNPRDSLAPTPLYNNATRTSVQPGSTFKPITAVAALQAGLNPNRRIYDKGYIKLGGRTFGCSLWNNYRGSHGYETLVTGIQNSCNFYFYCIATGTDWNNMSSLGYKEEMSVEKIMKVASEFGLGEKTGIELYETVTPLASAERKMKGMKQSLWSHLYYNSEKYWPESTISDDAKLREEISTITGWTEENPSRGTIINRIKEQTTVLESKVETITDVCKYSYFNQAAWTTGDEFNISIGQGDNAYTPLQMANYVATLGNDGKRNQVSIIKGIEGEGLNEKNEAYQIDVEENDLDKVLEGMRLVAKKGTLASCFSRFPVEVAGKTGTAERSGYINPKDEVTYVKKHLSSIAPGVSWKEVQQTMTKMMKEDPKKYPTENDTVDDAIIAASDKKVTYADINKYKDTYDHFAWTIALAPADNPKIAVAVLLIQGGVSSNAAPVSREIIGEYLDVKKTTEAGVLDFSTKMN